MKLYLTALALALCFLVMIFWNADRQWEQRRQACLAKGGEWLSADRGVKLCVKPGTLLR